MTREQALEWAKSLKPGDVIVQVDWRDLYALTVEKVTPTGIVKTVGGKSFFQNSWYSDIVGRGTTTGHIVPATDELLAEARKQEADREVERRKAETVQKAWYKIRCISRISYEFAADFLELCEKHGIK